MHEDEVVLDLQLSEDIAMGRPVTQTTIFIQKKMFKKIGIFIQGQDVPVVTSSSRIDILPGDFIYIINGRVCKNAKLTSYRIWVARNLSITLLRNG